MWFTEKSTLLLSYAPHISGGSPARHSIIMGNENYGFFCRFGISNAVDISIYFHEHKNYQGEFVHDDDFLNEFIFSMASAEIPYMPFDATEATFTPSKNFNPIRELIKFRYG